MIPSTDPVFCGLSSCALADILAIQIDNIVIVPIRFIYIAVEPFFKNLKI